MSVQIATNLEIDKIVHLVVKDSVHVRGEVIITVEIITIATKIESEIIDVDIEAEVVHKNVIEDHIQYLHLHRQCHHVEINESNNNNFIS